MPKKLLKFQNMLLRKKADGINLCNTMSELDFSDSLCTELDNSEFEAEVCIMNIGFWSCIILVIPFLIIGVLFAIFKEKATKFVSGFNSFSKEEQALYDKAHISRDIRNQCFMWAIIMLAGALLSCFLTPYIAIPTYIIWLVLFFREFHFDNHKAFEKYLLK